MSRRTLALFAVATVAIGVLTGCSRTEDSTYPEFPRVGPTPVNSAPMVVPYPAREDNVVVGRGAQG